MFLCFKLSVDMAQMLTVKILALLLSIHSVCLNDSSAVSKGNDSDFSVLEPNTTEYQNFSSYATESSETTRPGAEYNSSDAVDTTLLLVSETGDSVTKEVTTLTHGITELSTDGPSIQTTEKPPSSMNFSPGDICSCDLTVDICDTNCCCDQICTQSDRQVFSHCMKRQAIAVGLDYCYQTNFIYFNNTEYKIVEAKDGLFCILWDNLPSVEVLYNWRKAVTSVHEFRRLTSGHLYYTWPSLDTQKFTFQSNSYRFGSTVWSFSNLSLVPLALPSNLVSTSCQISVPVRYLVDWSGSCSSPNLKCGADNQLSASSYYASRAVIASPQLVNLSQVGIIFEHQGCQNICVPFNLFLCSRDNEDVDDCYSVDDIESPVYDNVSNVCFNIVRRVHYLVRHNGTLGIVSVELYFWLVDVTSSTRDIQQKFSISFLWIDKPKKPTHRSGNPGYILGKPVIIGHKTMQVLSTNDEPNKEVFLISEGPSRWLTLPKAGGNRLCLWGIDVGSRLVVNFGENVKSDCVVELAITNFSSVESCSLMQNKILTLLVGNALENVTDVEQFKVFIAAFGDANPEQQGDWVRLLLKNVPLRSGGIKQEDFIFACKNIVTSVHLDISFAKVGLASWSQAKILGVVLKFGPAQDLLFDCVPYLCSSVSDNVRQMFSVSSSVTFLDTSQPPIAVFAEPPVYEVKLPFDFFYPFVSRSCISKLYGNWFAILFVIVYFLLVLAR